MDTSTAYDVAYVRQPAGARAGQAHPYARVTPGSQAGTVTVTISAVGQHSEVEVTYEMTALSGPAADRLREFAAGYPAYLQSWEDAIGAWLETAANTGR